VIDFRLGRWQDVLSDVTCDALIFDAPYSGKTHEAETTRVDGGDPSGLTPQYDFFTPAHVRQFCEAWEGERCRGWMVSVTDSELFPVWRDEMERIGRYAFRAPVPIVIRGMSVRMQQDGPSSWALYAAVSRPRGADFARWGILPGAYVGTVGPQVKIPQSKRKENERSGGRGKPSWMMNAIVRDYTRPADLICDPFGGWAATLMAAASLGRHAVGAELDADAHAEGLRRLARPLQVDLFDGRDDLEPEAEVA
jgi:hypothetical protein